MGLRGEAFLKKGAVCKRKNERERRKRRPCSSPPETVRLLQRPYTVSFAEEDLSTVVDADDPAFCFPPGGSLGFVTNSMATISAASPTRRLVLIILV